MSLLTHGHGAAVSTTAYSNVGRGNLRRNVVRALYAPPRWGIGGTVLTPALAIVYIAVQ